MSKPLHTWKIAETIPLDTCFGMGYPSDSKVGSHPCILMGNHPYISIGNIDYLSIEVLMRHSSKPLLTWKIAVTTPLSLFNATPRIPALVWVYQAIQK